MIEDLLYRIEELALPDVSERPDALAQGQPELSGDIDIRIDSEGVWHHEGRPIRRQALARLLLSVLRRETDGDYYLVTPAEKWRIRVDELPLLVVDCTFTHSAPPVFQLNLGYTFTTMAQPPLYRHRLRHGEEVPALPLPNGLAALFTRAAWYRLAQQLELRDGYLGVRAAERFIALYSA